MAAHHIFLAVLNLACVFFFSGIVFGWAAFSDMLVREGYYAYKCPGKVGPCDEQAAALNQAYTVATTAVSLVALPGGWFVDTFGPLVAIAVAGVLEVVGLVGIALSKDLWKTLGGDFDIFLVALVVIAVAGSLVMFNGYQVPFLFPSKLSLLIEINSCLFDASTIIFPIFKIFYDAGLGFQGLFWIYVGVAVVMMLLATAGWVLNIKELWEIRRQAGETDGENDSNGPAVSATSLMSKPLKEQFKSVEFVAIFIYGVIQIPRSNIYMGTVDMVNKQIADASDESGLKSINTIIALVIPFGFCAVPAIETSIHKLGLVGTLQLTTILGMVYNAMQLIPELYTQLGTVVFFAAWRAFLFSIISAFNADTFGPRTMGRIMGVCFLVSGVANLVQIPLVNLSLHKLDGNFKPMLIGILIASVPLPFVVQAVGFKWRRAAREIQAPLATATARPTVRRVTSHGVAGGDMSHFAAQALLDRSMSRRHSGVNSSIAESG